MKSILRILILGQLLILQNLILYANDPIFGSRIDLGLIEYDPIDEASGLAASRINPGVLWTHNDSGDLNRIFALNLRGKHLGIYTIANASNLDWEDMATGPGPLSGQQYLYIGDIGDNLAQRDSKYIYRIPEPVVDSSQAPIDTTVTGAEKIKYRYPDGQRDAETLMVDPLTNDIYIVSKREAFVRVYRLPYPQSIVDTITADHVATLDLAGGQTVNERYTVGGDISSSGNEILIKTYINVFYWNRTTQPNLWDVFQETPDTVTYTPEPQGEAICWHPDGLGYYTVSEERQSIPAHLYFYPRISSIVNLVAEILACQLHQNYPNPFNPSTTIEFNIPKTGEVTLKVFNILGEEVATLISDRLSAGSYSYEWDASSLVSGVYLYRLQAGDYIETRKMILMK